jgi:hypothetical protein
MQNLNQIKTKFEHFNNQTTTDLISYPLMRIPEINNYMLLSLILAFGFLSANAQEIPEIGQNAFPGLTVSSNNVYDGNALWGYMNGGADLYLEYGFEGLRVQEIEIDGNALKLEIYRMESPLDAFGMMSIKRFRCNETSLFVPDDCLTGYQYQAAKGTFYLNVINFTGNEEGITKTKEVAQSLVQLIEAGDFQVPSFADLDKTLINPAEIKYARGKLGLQNSISKWISLFDEVTEYEIFYLPVEIEGQRLFIADVIFDSKEEHAHFIRQHFDLVEDFPTFQVIGNKTFGIKPLTDKSLRLIEFTGDKAELEDTLQKFGF